MWPNSRLIKSEENITADEKENDPIVMFFNFFLEIHSNSTEKNSQVWPIAETVFYHN